MWPVSILTSNRAAGRLLAETMAAADRRIAPAVATRLDRIAGVPLLVLVSLPHGPQRSLDAVAALRRAFPATAILVELTPEPARLVERAFAAGASDCLKAPALGWEWRHRGLSLIEGARCRRVIHATLRRAGHCLAKRGEAATPQMLAVLAHVDRFRDAATAAHDRRAGRLARLVAEALGLPADDRRLIEAGVSMHDIGKLGIPDAVLRKPGRFTDADYAVMRAHPQIGHAILSAGASPALQMAAAVALGHHERFDGSGYPFGLQRDEIPLPSRIAAVADVFDSLTAGRTYRRAAPVDEGIAYLLKHRGTLFDPGCVDALRARHAEAAAIVAA